MRAIVNLSTGKYVKGQTRLLKECKKHFNGDVFTFTNEREVGSPTHKESPYEFKLHAIQKVRDKGYTSILWCDASLYPVKEVNSLFDRIENVGYHMEEAGHFVRDWCNENARQYFKLSQKELDSFTMFSAGFTGLDFKNTIANDFFVRWLNSAKHGAFKGSWSNHRHDMTCGSIIAQRMGLEYSKGGSTMAYIGKPYGEPAESVYFHCKGIA